MPIYDICCQACGHTGEVIELASTNEPECPECGSHHTEKRMAPTSSLTGKSRTTSGPDTDCCGGTPGIAGCGGPGSCCGAN